MMKSGVYSHDRVTGEMTMLRQFTQPIGQLESDDHRSASPDHPIHQEHQAHIVEAQFLDSPERCHKFIAKSAIFTTDWGP